MVLQATLTSLTAREGIADALYRASNGLDFIDAKLFDSAFTTDAVFELDGRVMEGLEAIHAGCFDRVAKMDTTHFNTNVRIDVKDGNSQGSLTATTLIQHYRLGEGKHPDATRFLAGTHYDMDVVKDDRDGLWKIKFWRLTVSWWEGDLSIMTGEAA